MLYVAVPEWSGKFYEMGGEGVMAVSIRDHQTHRPPAGWRLVEVHETASGEYEVYEYVRVA